MTRRMFSVPARWPARREKPRRGAQRPLPSMMMATCLGTWGRARRGGGGGLLGAVAVIAMVVVTSIERPGRGEGCCPRALDGQHFLLFRVACFVDPFDVVVGKLLKFGLGPVQVVLGNLVVVLQATYLIVAVAADVTGGDAGVFHALPHLFGYLPSAVLRQFAQGQPDNTSVLSYV